MIYLLTVNYNSSNLVAKLIDSLSVDPNVDYKIVIINNSPKDNYISQLKSESVTILEAGENLGFGLACNLGIKWVFERNPQAIIWLINPDAYFLENNLDKVQDFFEKYPQISILGTIVRDPKGEIWFSGGRFIPQTGAILTEDLLKNTDSAYIPCDWISGCSLIIYLKNFPDCPYFDPAYFLYYEDFDFCRRYVNQGHLIAITKEFGIIHQPSSITNRNIFRKIKHSTYSYLLTQERYTNNIILTMRLSRIIIYALLLIFFRPKLSLGKFIGVSNYLFGKKL
ncbi:glycosyltransferase [Mastigocoleus testarum]|uniref:Glycosyl transferase n=1 Tax=Mastigocoleus testarum BC008 TaxID=371196 RepID=A0A0V7ZSI3_9CYAN|nr:glycosyltransferase family 2 protein [Mastigocoleus testarum]KST67361.1 glycosyl transferase [Mastigocoleus testarum BC008]